MSTGAGTAGALSRALDLYRRTASSGSALVLLAANAIPLVGVLFFGWSLWTILILYWLENGIVGFWSVPKILLAQGSAVPTLPDLPPEAALAATGDPLQASALREAWARARAARARQLAEVAALGRVGLRVRGFSGAAARAPLAAFFCLHYGIFWLVHGVFIFALPLFLGSGATCNPPPVIPGFSDPGSFGSFPFGSGADVAQACGSGFGSIEWTSILIGGIALFLSHGASFLFNYIGRGEYLTASPGGQTAAPYARVVILHVTIILGAFVVAFLGAPIGALVILVTLKAIFDLGLHLRERRRADARFQAPAAAAPPHPPTTSQPPPAAPQPPPAAP